MSRCFCRRLTEHLWNLGSLSEECKKRFVTKDNGETIIQDVLANSNACSRGSGDGFFFAHGGTCSRNFSLVTHGGWRRTNWGGKNFGIFKNFIREDFLKFPSQVLKRRFNLQNLFQLPKKIFLITSWQKNTSVAKRNLLLKYFFISKFLSEKIF